MNARALVTLGCGTAIACVCAIGLAQIGTAAGGIWAIAAVLIAAGICWALARVFGRLSAVVPSGAGLLAWPSRGFGRRAGLAIAVPYVLLSLFLVGVEATIVGTLLGRVVPGLPVWAGSAAFLVGTWAFCRAGFQVGFKAQAVATVALVVSLAGLSILAIGHAGAQGALVGRMFPALPSVAAFVGSIGTAIFLFMGFELVTAHAEQSDAKAVARGLTGTIAVLAVFYALVSAGFSCLGPQGLDPLMMPQVAIAEQTGSPLAVGLMVGLCLLSSFTSFNGALLGLARFGYALAAQGVLPKAFATLDPKTRAPKKILNALLGLALLFTAVVGAGHALGPAILAAAVAASVFYAAAAWVREGVPFAEGGRSRWAGRGLAIALLGLAAAVIVDAGPDRAATVALLGFALATAAFLAARLTPGRRSA